METRELDSQFVMHTYNRFPLVLTRGKGVFAFDDKGKKYIDCVAGVAVNNFGHCHPKIVAAIKKQASELIHCSNWFYNLNQPLLAKKICDLSGMKKVFFCNSGAEAIDGAIKLAMKSTGKKGFVSAVGAFHGRTLGSLSLTWKEKYKAPYMPLFPSAKFVEYNNPSAIEAAIDENTAAVILEPVQGEGGINIPSDDYLVLVKGICEKRNILLILDEVQTGFGRTGKPFAFQHTSIMPDIICMAKGLGGGFPMGAFAATEKVAAAFSPGDHGSTFGGTPLACAAALAAMDVLESKKLCEASEKSGAYFLKLLKKIKSPKIKDVRGKGLLIGVELTEPARPACEKLIEKGVLASSTSDTVIRFAPPLLIKKKEIKAVVSALAEVLGGTGA